MKSLALFSLILKQTHTRAFLRAFLIAYVVCCLVLHWIDPVDLPTYGDAFWFGFIVFTTIGLGDYTVTTLPARLITVFLGVYGILAIGFICGVGASWLFEKVRESRNESVSLMLYQLEHLDELSDEELENLKQRVKDQTPDVHHQIKLQRKKRQKAKSSSN